MSNVTFQRVVKQYGNFTALQSLAIEIHCSAHPAAAKQQHFG
jgi:hypothetical protein